MRVFDLSLEKWGQWRSKWAEVLISLPQLQIGSTESWKPCLNLCTQRLLNLSLNLISNLPPVGVWQLKTLFPEGRMNFKRLFLKIFKLSELRIFRSNLFHSMTAEEKKEFWKKECLRIEGWILLVFLVLYVLALARIMLDSYFGDGLLWIL